MQLLKRHVFLIPMILFLLNMDLKAQAELSKDSYRKVTAGYIMVLKPGEDILEKLKFLAKAEKIPSATFSAIGFAQIRFGFFDKQKKRYLSKDFPESELLGMNGSIAWSGDTVSIHAHGIISDRHYRTHGGHILAAKVGQGTLEIYITVYPGKLERKPDAATGAMKLCLDCNEKK